MFERVLLLFTQRENYPPSSYVRRVPAAVTHAFTAVQVVCRGVDLPSVLNAHSQTYFAPRRWLNT